MSIPINTRIAFEGDYKDHTIWLLQDPAPLDLERVYGFVIKSANYILYMSDLEFGDLRQANKASRIWLDAYNQGAGK